MVLPLLSIDTFFVVVFKDFFWLLGFVTCFVAVSSRMIGINPDNIATPISATLGDLVSLTLLSNIASLLYNPDGKYLVFF